MRKMKVLVAGSNGFIGKYVSENLKVGEVVTVSREQVDLSRPVPEGRLPDVDAVINCVGTHGRKTTSKEALYKGNVETVKNLAKYYEGRGIEQFIHMSSFTVYGEEARYMAREEDAEIEPNKIGEYGKSKREAERWLKKSGVPFTILRPDCIFGEGDPYLLPLFKMVDDRRVWLPYGGRAMLRPVYVGDLLKVMELCIERRVRREVYNVGGGLICSVDGFVNMIEEIMYGKRCAERYRLNGKTLKAVEVVSDVLSWVARKKVGIPTERADWFRYDKVGSTDKLARLGFTAGDYEEQLTKTVEWYRKNGWLG
jgi:nucleoside-diphosphate-sugar epimerase